jgi:hypothetical protein
MLTPNIGPADPKASDLPLARPERPLHCPSLIPAGDRYSSRGQRPRKTPPPAGPTLKGSNPGGVTPVLRVATQGSTTQGRKVERRAFRGRDTTLCPCRVRKPAPPRLRAVRAGAGQHPRRGQKCPPGLTFCLPVGKIVSYPLDNPLLLNGKMPM